MNMEHNKPLDKFLLEKMSTEEMDITLPPAGRMVAARNKIMERQKPAAAESIDLFSMIASFLNFKVKLYQAVLAMIVICGSFLFYSGKDTETGNERTDDSVSNIASVRSSTVLSSIYTFGVNKKSYDGRASN